MIQEVVDYLAAKGLEPPEGGIRDYDLEATPAY